MKLIDMNLRALDQARDLLSAIDDVTFVQMAPHTNGIRIGAHIRHVIEFYERFLTGLAHGCVDYEGRSRNTLIERSRAAAVRAIDDVADGLAHVTDGPIGVRTEELVVPSSRSRELQALLEHTIHHFALIAVALAALGVAVDPDFGVAPSTLRYRAKAA